MGSHTIDMDVVIDMDIVISSSPHPGYINGREKNDYAKSQHIYGSLANSPAIL